MCPTSALEEPLSCQACLSTYLNSSISKRTVHTKVTATPEPAIDSDLTRTCFGAVCIRAHCHLSTRQVYAQPLAHLSGNGPSQLRLGSRTQVHRNPEFNSPAWPFLAIVWVGAHDSPAWPMVALAGCSQPRLLAPLCHSRVSRLRATQLLSTQHGVKQYLSNTTCAFGLILAAGLYVLWLKLHCKTSWAGCQGHPLIVAGPWRKRMDLYGRYCTLRY